MNILASGWFMHQLLQTAQFFWVSRSTVPWLPIIFLTWTNDLQIRGVFLKNFNLLQIEMHL